MHPTSIQLAGTVPSLQKPIKLVRRNLLGIISCLSLAALCILNMNYLTRAMFGMGQVFSVLYLLACVVTLFAFRFRIGTALGSSGVAWILTILFYLAVSTRAGMGIPTAYFTSPQSNLYRLLIAQVITIAMALGVRHLMLLGKLQATLRILFGLTVVASLTIVLTKKAPWILQFVGQQSQDRSAGFFADANRAGQAVCASAAFGFACLVNETNRWKVFSYVGLIALVPCLFLTFSRSSIIFMVLLVMLQFIISPILKKKETLIGMLVLALAIPIGISVVMNRKSSNIDAWDKANKSAQKERMESLFRIMSGNFDASDTGHRFVLAAVGVKYFLSNPVIGVGYRKLTKMPEVDAGCHNTFLRIAGEAGLFSVIAFVGSIVFMSICAWRCGSPPVKCLVIGYLAMYACSGMVSHSLLTNRLHNVAIGVCIGLLSAAKMLQKHEARQRKATRAMQDRALVGRLTPSAMLPTSTALPQPKHASSI